MSNSTTCKDCENAEQRAIEKVALAIQERHDNGSSFAKAWSNHHGLLRCDCDELVEFVRSL